MLCKKWDITESCIVTFRRTALRTSLLRSQNLSIEVDNNENIFFIVVSGSEEYWDKIGLHHSWFCFSVLMTEFVHMKTKLPKLFLWITFGQKRKEKNIWVIQWACQLFPHSCSFPWSHSLIRFPCFKINHFSSVLCLLSLSSTSSPPSGGKPISILVQVGVLVWFRAASTSQSYTDLRKSCPHMFLYCSSAYISLES